MFRYVILGLFRRGRGYYGYALMKAYRARFGLEMGTGTFYRELQRLVVDGCIERTPGPLGDDPRRACYEITAAGEAAFDRWLTEQVDSVDACAEDELSARVLFLIDASPDRLTQMLERWREELWFHAKTVERRRERALVAEPVVDEEFWPPLPLILARCLKQNAADLEFISALQDAYEAWQRRADATTKPAPDSSGSRRGSGRPEE